MRFLSFYLLPFFLCCFLVIICVLLIDPETIFYFPNPVLTMSISEICFCGPQLPLLFSLSDRYVPHAPPGVGPMLWLTCCMHRCRLPLPFSLLLFLIDNDKCLSFLLPLPLLLIMPSASVTKQGLNAVMYISRYATCIDAHTT